MSAATKTRYAPTANPQYAAAIAELRRSNASGTHQDTRVRRARSRQASVSRAIRDFA